MRKQSVFYENTILPALKLEDFRSDLLVRIRKIAKNQRPDHPWLELDNFDLLKSSGLYQKNYRNGESGFTLAAALLLGKDEVIQSILPHYKTDAILRVENTDRYDDREDIRTNLIESYERLMDFVKKHLPDSFHLEGEQRISLRDRIFREVMANSLIHREYSNAYPAKLIIERDQVLTENWNKPHGTGLIDPKNFSPYPKNPSIAKFFKEIGRVDELGSGIRNIFKYSKLYSQREEPKFIEGDIFKTIIPLPATSNQVSNQGDNRFGFQSEKIAEKIEALLGTFKLSFSTENLDKYFPLLKELTIEQIKILDYTRSPKKRKEILEDCLQVSNQTKNFITHIEPLLNKNLISRTIKDKPRSQNQKYVNTEKGNIILHILEKI